MSAAAPEPGPGAGPISGSLAFDSLEIGRLTWIGLILAGIGWALLLGETASVDILAKARTGFHADLHEIARCIIMSGFALAIVGALQSGFGTLNRFFAAVLLRSNQRAVATAPMHQAPMRQEPTRPAPVVERAAPRGRPYRTLPDGSVEVETILGTRRFETMREAREFI